MKRKRTLPDGVMRLPLGDPEPPPDEIRKKVSIWMAPTIQAAIDARRTSRNQSRSMWIEEAIRERIRREDDRS